RRNDSAINWPTGRVSGGSAGGSWDRGIARTLTRRDLRLPVHPVHLEQQPRLVQRLEVRDLFSFRRVDHVSGVADVHEPAVRTVLEPPDAAAVVRRAGILVAGQRL